MKGYEADREVKEAARAQGIYLQELPHKDYYLLVKKRLFDELQDVWTNITQNKLRTVKGAVKLWRFSSNKDRKCEIVQS